MCGIAGIVNFDGRPVVAEELAAMCGALAHRGPDEDGFYVGPGVGLGMRRLSIIDLQTGRQPIRNEDGSVWVVFNGEIYNFKELREELEGRGHVFATATDTETIAHLYEDHGPRCVEKLRGMFAFALWDERRQQLLLARDRLGIKPLYFAELGGRLLFASELKAILALGEIETRLDWSALSHLFAFLATPREASLIEGVRKLEPGQMLIASAERGVRLERYWDVRFEPDYGRSEAYFVERLRELLEESVRLHLVSDVPLGAFLSGGVDSSSMVALMSRLVNEPIKTFSIGFTDEGYSELEHARLVSKRFGTEHHELVLEPDALGIVEDLAWYLDEPLGDPSAIPTYLVSRLAAESVTVVLSGDGGDELFAGYDKYVVEGRERRYRFVPRPLRKLAGRLPEVMPDGMRGRNFLRHLAFDGVDRYLDATTLFRLDEQSRLFAPEVAERLGGYDPWAAGRPWLTGAGGHWLSALQYADLNGYLPLDILTKVDRMSMAHSIEARVPLLDHKVVEFAATIPPELQLKNGVTKYVFKEAMRGLLPASILDRPKHGFAVPLGRWFRGRLGGVVRDLLLSAASRRRGIFDPRYLEGLIAQHEAGRPLDFRLWTLMSFELWCRVFLDGRGRDRVRTTRREARPVLAGRP
ncbi:MAG TPA: asparagine synthase (glutamine-hydrolyzing) [Methylomirabilota bacterium]|jgi:asparagine synthase (glutamine-hydrolysing)|nr:asparagine synthase (glutamine-hydrolyzing) [Methylomirabilota bacterium]